MAGYKADEHVTYNGPRGNGYSYEYDKKTGKWGVLYGGVNGTMVPDPEEKQPGYRPPEEPKRPKEPKISAPTGPSDYDRGIDDVTGQFEGAFADAAKGTAKTVTGIIAFIIGLAAAKTFSRSMAENPDDVKSAAIKTGRTIACSIGILLSTAALFVYSIIGPGIENPIAETIGNIVAILLIYTDFGLIRVARGKSFLINPVAALPKIRTIKVPKIAYVVIELLVTALLTKPILMWINEFITRLVGEDIAISTVIILGIAMLAGSIIIAAIIGLIVCKLIKAVTAK